MPSEPSARGAASEVEAPAFPIRHSCHRLEFGHEIDNDSHHPSTEMDELSSAQAGCAPNGMLKGTVCSSSLIARKCRHTFNSGM
jgi:hypothetical protein